MLGTFVRVKIPDLENLRIPNEAPLVNDVSFHIPLCSLLAMILQKNSEEGLL